MASSVFASVMAAGLAALGQFTGFAVARATGAAELALFGGVSAGTHPADAKAINAIDPFNRIKTTPAKSL